MSRRKQQGGDGHPTPEGQHDYEVGYRKPPEATRWKKGQSGNPNGRPRASRDVVKIIEQALSKKVTVREGGRKRKMPAAEAAELAQINSAMRGDQVAFGAVIKKMIKHKLMVDERSQSGRGYLAIPETLSVEAWERELEKLHEDQVRMSSIPLEEFVDVKRQS